MNYVEKLRARIRSRSSKHVAQIKQINEELCSFKAAAGVMHQPAALTNLSVQYKNGLFIGTQLMPIVSVSHKSDIFYKYDKRDRLSGPDDRIGNRSTPNEINEKRTTDNYSLRDYALKNFVSNETLRDQDAPLNEMVDLTQALNDVVALKMEQRIAAIMTTAGNYSGNTEALAGVDQFDNASNTSIVRKLQQMGETMWSGSNATRKIAFCSLEVWNAIARNSNIRGLFQYTKAGLASKAQVAQYFGFDDILVSDARQDTANEGAAASYSRIWGKVFGCVQVAVAPSIRSAHFGSTFQLVDDPSTDAWFDPSIGKSGGYWARVGVSQDHKVVAGDTGFLYTGAIA